MVLDAKRGWVSGRGGFDQGLELGDGLVRAGFRLIAPSRFGYLRTPLPADASAEAQADAHASLLDALGAGLICSGVSVITSDTLSTTIPTTRPPMFSTITTVNWS